MIDEISVSEGVPVIYFPFSFILVLSAIKDLYEDSKRHKSDKIENMRHVHVYDENIRLFTEKE